jgi:hypothetical protein
MPSSFPRLSIIEPCIVSCGCLFKPPVPFLLTVAIFAALRRSSAPCPLCGAQSWRVTPSLRKIPRRMLRAKRRSSSSSLCPPASHRKGRLSLGSPGWATLPVRLFSIHQAPACLLRVRLSLIT